MNPEVLEFLALAETLVGWADDHLEPITQARACSRRNGDEPDTLTGIDELDDLDIADNENGE